MRGDNAQLMETNLLLLMEIRETDTEIDTMRIQLRAQCDTLQKRGIQVPENFTELLAQSLQGNQRPAPATTEQQ